MKKICAIAFLLVYLVSVSGIALSMHWCGGKLNTIKIVYAEHHSCCCLKKPMKKGCCKDEVSYCKIDTAHSPNSSLNLVPPDFQKPTLHIQPVLLSLTDQSGMHNSFA